MVGGLWVGLGGLAPVLVGVRLGLGVIGLWVRGAVIIRVRLLLVGRIIGLGVRGEGEGNAS